MSAILFKQEDHLGLPNAIQLHNSDGDVCEELLGSKMSALELNENEEVIVHHHHSHNHHHHHHHQQHQQQQQQHYDGSDSGVDIATTNVTLQRALSSNSGGYASSSNGGLDETTTTTTHVMNMSGDSSMISCSSDLFEMKSTTATNGINSATVDAGVLYALNNYECYSENGSESSSIHGTTATTLPRTANNVVNAAAARRSNSMKKRVALFEAATPTSQQQSSQNKERDSHPKASTKATPSRPRPSLSGLKRTASLSRPTPNQMKDRFGEKLPIVVSNNQNNKTTTTSYTATTPSRGIQMRCPATKPQKPDTLPNTLSRTQSISMQRLAQVQRTPSLSRARTPCTPSDDGRWPSTGAGHSRSTLASKRGLSVTPDLMSLKMRSNNVAMASVDSGAKATNCTNPYSTLPRRRKQKSVEDLSVRISRSNSITRESRMTSSFVVSSRKSLVNSYGVAGSAAAAAAAAAANTTSQTKVPVTAASSKSSVISTRKMQPTKTRIYHETSVQTALTSVDIEKAFAGEFASTRAVDAAEQHDQQTQSDIRDPELKRLQAEIKRLTQHEHELTAKLQLEREEKVAMQQRVMGMLEMARFANGHKTTDGGTPTSAEEDGGGGSGHDSLLMLESQIQLSGYEHKQEIKQLRHLCRSLQIEMERSLAMQQCLLQEKAVIEQESNELQDFLQYEKAAMCDALKELETEYHLSKQQLTNRDEEVKVLRDECRHLVRLNEQRRQENRMLQSKYSALEAKSKELIMQQNYSVSNASAALSGLHTRLDNLVEQLVSSYNISEQDLEDIGFQNEISANGENGATGSSDVCGENQIHSIKSNGSLDMSLQQQQHHVHHNSQNHHHHQHQHHRELMQSSDGSLSPQRNQSFIAAVISAIRNATTHSGKKLLKRNSVNMANSSNGCSADDGGGGGNNTHNNNGNANQNRTEANNDGDSDSTEMLDSETEPCLMMDNVLEDVTMPDTHSHNMVSSCTGMISQIEIPSEVVTSSLPTAEESLHNLSQAITNRQQMELQINAMNVQKVTLQLNQCEPSHSEDISCHDSVAEMSSMAAEYYSIQAVVDQVIEVDSLVTKLLKVLRLIQMDNDNCIQQLIVDKNKLQQNKEDMLEKLKDLEDVNMKLQDELMDATQELMLKNNELSSSKSDIQRHRNEIDRLTEDVCNLSTLCSNYRKLSPTTEMPPLMQLLSTASTVPGGDNNGDDVAGILNLLKMWQAEGQFKDARVRHFLDELCKQDKSQSTPQDTYNERLRIYANQLENVLKLLENCSALTQEYPVLQQLRSDIEVVKVNANWAHVLQDNANNGIAPIEDMMNANEPTINECDFIAN